MSKLEKLKEKAKTLEAKDPKGAVEAWLEVLTLQDDEAEANPDLSIYNRVGDLYVKLKNPGDAADYYDKAVDKYAEQGLHNNAIAMCNKVLRNAPGRPTVYLKLAKLYAAKGFMAEAKQNFVEYAERMQKVGKIQHAFSALKEFTDISPESEDLRKMLEEHLKMYGAPERRSMAGGRPSSTLPPIVEEHKDPRRKTSSLVFLDLDAPAGSKAAAPPAKVAPAKAAPPNAPRPPVPEPEVESILDEPTAEPDTSLEIETTSLVEETVDASGGALDGLEITSSDFGSVLDDAGATPSLREEVDAGDVEPMAGLEPTAEDGDAGDLGLIDIDAEPEPEPPPKPAPKFAPKFTPKMPARPSAPTPKVGPPPRVGPPPKPGAVPKIGPPPKVGPPPRVGPPPKPAPAKAAPPPAAPLKRKTVVEIPPLELEPDFETATADTGHDVDDEPLAMDEAGPTPTHPDFIQTEDDTSLAPGGRRSGFIDLGVEGIMSQGDAMSSLVFDNIEPDTAASGTSIEDLEGHVADNPDDPEAHQALGEALIEAGNRDRGVEELDIATAGFEAADNLQQAQDLVDEILRVDPNSVRHRQKLVEFAFKSGDKAKLIDAYVELADTLLRGDLPDKARSVYERVVEHDPKNQRARSALAMLSPPPAAPADKKATAKDAKMKVRGEYADGADYVDLGAMMLEEEAPERDTRMTVEDEEPTGDEEQDFQDMLARFKQGIDENIEEGDFQSHYDLGVAFKEMGLLDEAIAEFQKALRAPEGKLRTSEALGACFFDKKAYTVAESILRRGLELPAQNDEERLGILYWLGRALEEQGKAREARELYGRAFAVNIRFMDVGERVKALAKAK